MPSNLKLPLTVHVIDPAMLIPGGDVNRVIVEASTLGLKPGEVPGKLEPKDRLIGNGNIFILQHVTPERFVYVQQFGTMTLTVLND